MNTFLLTSFPFWLVVLALLTAYLFLSVGLRERARVRAEQARLRAIEKEYPARGFDTSAIAPRIRRVRQDYTASPQRYGRPLSLYCRDQLIAAARRLVTNLAYFRRVRHENQLHKRDA